MSDQQAFAKPQPHQCLSVRLQAKILASELLKKIRQFLLKSMRSDFLKSILKDILSFISRGGFHILPKAHRKKMLQIVWLKKCFKKKKKSRYSI